MMTFKEFYRREKCIALHAQSRRFRIVKYCVLLAVAVGVYVWKGWAATGLLFFLLFAHRNLPAFLLPLENGSLDKVLGALQAHSFRRGINRFPCRRLSNAADFMY